MHELTRIIKDDMAIALGVTEPGAIAFCAAKARSLIGGALIGLEISVNGGLYKNADACCIPNSSAFGSAHAAALGYVAGDPEKGLKFAGRSDAAGRRARPEIFAADESRSSSHPCLYAEGASRL